MRAGWEFLEEVPAPAFLAGAVASVLAAEESFIPLGGLAVRYGWLGTGPAPGRELPGPTHPPGAHWYRAERRGSDGRTVEACWGRDRTEGESWCEVRLEPGGDWGFSERARWRPAFGARHHRTSLARTLRELEAAGDPATLARRTVILRALAAPLPASSLGRFRGLRALDCLLLHEIGHHRLEQALGLDRDVAWEGHCDPVSDAAHGYRHPLTSPLAEGESPPPTLYGATDAHEWFAECYALWRMGRGDLLSATDRDLLGRVLAAARLDACPSVGQIPRDVNPGKEPNAWKPHRSPDTSSASPPPG